MTEQAADSNAVAAEYLEHRFEDVQKNGNGWTALCPCCDAETRIHITRDMVIETCPNGHTTEQIVDAVVPQEDPLQRVRTLEGLSLDDLELADIPTPEWLVEGFIEQESFGVVFGPPNAGKTFFAIHVICMAAARRWRVKFIEAEGGLFHLRKRLLRAARSIEGVDKNNINVSWCAPLDISKKEGAGQLVSAIKGYDLCVLDSMAALSGGVSENEEEWGRVSNNLAWARSLSGCSIFGVHHATKEAWKTGETPELRHLRGHGALAGRADYAFGVVPGPVEDGVVVFDLHDLKEREADKPKPRRCRVDMVSNAAHFTIDEVTATAGKPQPSEHDYLAKVESAIPFHGGWSKTKICNIVGGNAQRCRRAVDQLEHSSRIAQVQRNCFIRISPVQPVQTGLDGQTDRDPVQPVPSFRTDGGRTDGVKPRPAALDAVQRAAGEKEED